METLIQRARVIAEDAYIRSQIKEPTPRRTATEWADHIVAYCRAIQRGSFDHTREVQTALHALRDFAL